MKSIVFDAGNVLVELDPTWARRLDRDPAAVSAWLADSPVFHALERGETSEARFLEAFCAAFRIADRAAAREAFEAWVVGPYPGATALLDRLAIPAAILSNTNRLHWARFDPDRGLRSRALALPSHLLGARKPEPSVFARAAAILGTTELLFLDDREDNVRAARAEGWAAEVVFGLDQVADAISRHAPDPWLPSGRPVG